jgi:hypothetical protein
MTRVHYELAVFLGFDYIEFIFSFIIFSGLSGVCWEKYFFLFSFFGSIAGPWGRPLR